MKRYEREAASTGSSFLLRLTLPVVRSGAPFEGAEILDELPSSTGLVLWQGYRTAMAWVLAPPHEREGLFAPGAEGEIRSALDSADLPPELGPAVEVVRDILADPVAVDPRRVADACTVVADWAERRGDAPVTALCFTQAAAMCLPDDARLAFRAGGMARRRGSWDVAELWFRHASTVGRRRHDWEGHALAYLGLGNSYYQQGRYTAAKREHRKALRVSRRHGLREVQGRAHHDLFAVAIVTGDTAGAESAARLAFDAYGSTHPRIPALAHDTAYLWLTQGCFRRALPVFQALLLHFEQPQDRLRVLASVGRAAAGCGERSVFEEVRGEVWRLVTEVEGTEVAATSLLQVAHGAAALEAWGRAEEAAGRALAIGLQRGEVDIVSQAESVLGEVRSRHLLQLVVRPPSDSGVRAEADAFATSLVTSLLASAGAA